MCANAYKAKLLRDIVSKVMANVPSARNAELSSQFSEDDTESPSFEKLNKLYRVTIVQSVVMNEFCADLFSLVM